MASNLRAIFYLLLLSLLTIDTVTSAKYKQDEKIVLYVNKVGPYYNPQETYHYYSLAVCVPEKIEHRSLTLGEVLDGDRMAVSLYDIQFNKSVPHAELCTLVLTANDIAKLQEAVEDLYYFEFVFDDLLMRGFVGHLEEGAFLPHNHRTYLWTHLHFSFGYSGQEVVEANVSTIGATAYSLDDTEPPVKVTFTYSVSWSKSLRSYHDRNKELKVFFPKSMEIHWLSVINSVVLVCLLLGFVTIILMRVLHNDFARYNVSDDDPDDLRDQDNYGWKIISTDVFRFPQNKGLLSSIIGVGTQFITLSLAIILMALLGLFNVHRHHAMNSTSILLYALTSFIAGLVSTNFYRKINGESWVWNIILTSSLFAFPFFLTWSTVNSVAWYHGSTQALPFTTIILIMFMWLIVGFPLTILGGILGKNVSGGFDAPCRSKNIAREIPPSPWYHSTLVHMAVGGFLPFSSISVELYYIFATVWGREVYTLYGIVFIVFLILISVTACISVALTYFRLSAEDYRWWWHSILTAGSTGLFVFAYAFFYYYKRSHMYGTLQTVEYFGYTILICYVFFLMLSTVSFFASLTFVRYMYRNLKAD
ncbi:PREDICTED: transmembrane 9 superfamily member 1-like [Amphimedon queenslandica]|nr:PREDICTED: transmembrane 9 superfamily member 1-like [Amphimedon queenslandica]|eukprot:XP_003385405.1 PREDICTED: transmembrane 9 superfamily member 1-like [Amphimedon queenslandica]